MSKSRLHLIVNVDGGSSGNPGPSAAAAVVADADGDVLLEEARFLGDTTNNVAEYRALILGLELAAKLKPDAISIRSDSELMVRQVSGIYKVKSEALKPLAERVEVLIQQFQSVEISHIGRDDNVQADRLVKKAIDEAKKKRGAGKTKSGIGETFRLK